MNHPKDPSLPESQFDHKLNHQLLLVLVPLVALTAILTFIVLNLLSAYSPLERFTAVLLISIGLVLVAALILKSILDENVLKPIKAITETVRRFALGDLQQKVHLNRLDEFGLLAHFIDKAGEALQHRYQELEIDITKRNIQLKIGAIMADILASADNLDQILLRSAGFINDYFNPKNIELYLVNKPRDKIFLKVVSGRGIQPQLKEQEPISLEEDRNFNWVVQNNQVKDNSPGSTTGGFSGNSQNLPDTEITVPISSDDWVMGFIHVQGIRRTGFGDDLLIIINAIADNIAGAIKNRFSIGLGKFSSSAEKHLFRTSYTITTAGTEQQVFSALKETVKLLPYSAALFSLAEKGYEALFATRQNGQNLSEEEVADLTIPFFNTDPLIDDPTPKAITSLNKLEALPSTISTICRNLSFDSFRLYPLIANKKLTGLLILSPGLVGDFSVIDLVAISKLLVIAMTAIEKLQALQVISSYSAELETLNTISQSISTETNLEKLYQVIHQQIIKLMGEVNFLIALYEESSQSIEIPYMDDGQDILKVRPFPLGQGLTSIVIRTRQPLMIVEDTINRSRALGAIITGDHPAMSWLGVPMLIRDEVIGAIIVQDLENEHRFDEDDMRLLTILAAQVAVALRNIRLIEAAQKRSERDRQLFEITNKIRRESNIQGVLKTTAEELTAALGARSTHIQIGSEVISLADQGNRQSDKNGESG
jgi:GAF domain-containing protein/HAMP domain-containing protein